MGWIGAAVGAAGSIYGGINAAQAAGNVRKGVQQQMKDNQAWYDRRYNEDATQRADAQRLLAMTEESIKKRNRQAAGTAAVMGGTEESVAAEKEANNKLMADTTSQIVAANEARKDQIESQFLQTKNGLQSQLNDIEAQKAKAISDAIQGVTGAAAKMPI